MSKPTSPKFAATLVDAATVMPLLATLVRMSRERRRKPTASPKQPSQQAA